MVAIGDAVELGPAIGDRAGQEVEPAGGAFGIGHRRQARRQREAFHQRHDIDAALLKNGAVGQVDSVHFEFGDPIGDTAVLAREERGADPVGHPAEPQVETRGLHLVGQDRKRTRHCATRDLRAQFLRGQDPHVFPGILSQFRQALAPKSKPPAGHRARQAVLAMVGPVRFELTTSRPPDGRANQTALRPDMWRDK